MAFAALISLAKTIDRILNHTRYSFSVHVKQQIVTIHEYTIFLQAYLENFPDRAKYLEGRFRLLANETEDVLEILMLERFSSCEYEQQLSRVAEEIDSIAGEVMEIKNSFRIEDAEFGGGSSSSSSAAAAASSASSSSRLAPTSKDVMVGFDEDLLAIKTRLCGGSSKLQVVPIVGMAGIGKTTLARNAYDDPLVMEYFDIRVWVTVSQDCSAKEVLLGLHASMKDFIKESYGEHNHEEGVYKRLKGRRYLVIMDDVWNTEDWDVVRGVFPNDNNGSRIMLTTRLSDVAAYPDSSASLHEMVFMDADQSWILLRQRVFVDQDCPPELEEIGKTIAGNCKGLPLAIVAVAGLLVAVSKTPTSWKEIAKKVTSVVTADNGEIEEILSLSYSHLPHHLRPCFLYLGAFREDSEIRVSKLIRLWVAEGFLKCENQEKSLEEDAEECLEDLVKRNLVLVSKRRSNGKIKSCSLHDLVRDLCIRKAKEEEFLVDLKGEGVEEEGWRDLKQISLKHHRRIVVTQPDARRLSSIDGPSIHTIIMLLGYNYVKMDFLTSVRLLRVLDSGSFSVDGVSSTLSDQPHLRYLAIDSLRWVGLAMSNWENLQTLIIQETRGGWRISAVHDKYLPREIWRMQQLRHLLFCGRMHDPTTTLPLQKLQTLKLVSYYICTEAILKMVPNVKKLGVCCSKNEDGGAYLSNLAYLHQLESLALYSQDKLVLQMGGFVLPTTLKKLSLSGVFIPWAELTVVGSLPDLQVLKLREAFGGKGTRTWETNEGEFVKLEFLLIDTPSLMHWITECSHFPRLKSLLLHDCHLLRGIPSELGDIPTLELIEVKEFQTDYLGRLAKSIQEEQQELGNYSLQVRHTIHR